MNHRRSYPIQVTVNGVIYTEIVIDPHYEIKHTKAITDEIILELVRSLDRKSYFPEDVDHNGYKYFKEEGIRIGNKSYRLIWLTHPSNNFIGVVNAFRRPYVIDPQDQA